MMSTWIIFNHICVAIVSFTLTLQTQFWTIQIAFLSSQNSW
ncbi:hypothetical protein DCAR_0934431 [Daucus carota subsp. sativus]|uniref:Uncharacterized protein n=1 Tax=Daucus carota subsp. sativus TaxID=79200 RepID=A0AAF1BEB6_DAUCS|nr:hypothetical protein DCAR_0934431 [Daucus carota subsp. sativus]